MSLNDMVFFNFLGESIMKQKIIKIPEVVLSTALSRPTIYRLIKEGKFPKQIKLSERSSGWIEQEVIDYINNCIQKRDEK
jgi:prophage regulatory protein